MRKGNSSGGINLGSGSEGPLSGCQPAAKGQSEVAATNFSGGLRLRGVVSQRSKRAVNEDWELVTYNVSYENGSHLVEDFTPPGGPYISLGE